MKKLLLILIAIIASVSVFGTTVQIGKLYYDLQGTQAYVTKSPINTGYYREAKLTSITIPSKVTYNDKEYTVTEIHGSDIFNNCTTIVSVNMANTIQEIPQSAFYACSSLATLKLSNSLTEIPSNAFGHCNLKTLTIPNSVVSIGKYAFGYNPYLTSVTLGNKTVSIGETAFSSCGRLETIELPATVTSIGKQAFRECSTLVSLNIPETVIELGEGVCSNCSSLTNISIPGGVKAIRSSAFSNCTNLASVTLSEGLDTIGQYAFYYDALTSVIIPNSATYIGQYAFAYNANLASITIGSGLLKIDGNAFRDCPLTSIYISATTPPATTTYPPSSATSTCTIYVPAGSVSAYKAASWWKNFNILALPTYTITWKQDNGSTINTTSVTHGQMPTHSNPTKSATAEYTYTFKAWTPTIVPATANATYTATYTATKRKYTVTFNNYDGSQLQSGSVEYGKVPSYTNETPTKPSTVEYTYIFDGWTPEVLPVTGDAIYTAHFDSAKVVYDVDVTIPDTIETHGTVIIDGEATYGDTITLTPVPEDGWYFVEWSDGNTENPREIIVTGDTIIYPIFAQCEEIIVTFSEVITKGESYEFAGMSLMQRGTYMDTTVLANGCDSITVLKLNVVKAKTFNLRVVVNDETMGTVEGAGTFTQGQEVTITAIPASNKYVFVRWYNEDEDINVYDNPYTFTLNRNLQIRAVFRRGKK